MKKDELEIQKEKVKMIEEVRKLNKNEMFKPEKKKTLLSKLLIILGYGKKR